MRWILKYIFYWVAIFVFFVIIIPISVNMTISKKTSGEENENQKNNINVYFADEDRVGVMDAEDYILSVLMAEMPASFRKEALKAQSIAARTYLYEKLTSAKKEASHKGADICTDSTHCQAYISKKDAEKKWGKNASEYLKKCKNAVEATRGLIAQHDGKPIKAVFHAYASGKTENAADVWGTEVSYLQSVESPGDLTAPKYSTSVSVSYKDFYDKMTSEHKCDFTKGIFDTITYTEGGSVDEIIIGGVKFTGAEIRKIFGLRSACFSVSQEGENIVFSVKGYGHGVGMSQYGANYYAEKGLNYEEILKKYYSGIEIVKKYD